MENRKDYPFKVYLGTTKGTFKERIYLEGFSWNCGWYWGGGYIGNKNLHCHFNGCFLEVPDYRGHPLGNFKPENLKNGCSIWEPLSTFLDDSQFTENEWWRIKDLYKQFYIYQKAAEAFQYGGHCASEDRSKGEIKPDMAKLINDHIEQVIIPEIMKALKVK